MTQFKKKAKTSQEIPTSALPDIIFILLFFFMVTTTIRPTNLLVESKLPKVSQVQKVDQMNLVTYLYIGKPLNSSLFGKESKIQVNDTFISTNEIAQFIEQERVKLGDKRDLLIVSLKVDKEAKMGLVSDVQMALRDVDARKIIYSGIKSTNTF